MSAAPKKKAKAKKSKATSHQVTTATTAPNGITDNESLGKSWTDRPDSLRMLVECAALLGISDKINNEDVLFSSDRLAARAIEFINACEFLLKKETTEAGLRIKEHMSKLKDLRTFSTRLPYKEGANAVLKLKDARPERLDKGIIRLLEADFELNPRRPRDVQEIPLAFSLNRATDAEYFIGRELAWYKAKGFTPEDLRHLSELKKRKKPVYREVTAPPTL